MTGSEVMETALKLIGELDLWDALGKTDDDDVYRIMRLGYISGVTEFAKALCGRISEEAVEEAIKEHGRKEV